MSIRLVATDLDGTLLRTDKTFSARTTAAMVRAQAEGIRIVWATARGRSTVTEFAKMAGFSGYAICGNGAVVLDLADDGAVIRKSTIDGDTAETVMATIRQAVPGSVFALVGTHDFLGEPGYMAASNFTDHWLQPEEMQTSDRLREIPDGTVKIVARHPELTPGDLFRILQGAAIAQVEMTHSLAPFVEMSMLGVTKATTLATLCTEWGLDRSEVAAIGDALNDLPMIEWAGLGLAPANAMPEALAAADQVLPGNDDDGVATFLESLIGLSGT
ncbi:MAG TPA: HAD family hydrolase [Thermomicrobiales bacterium]|nr:HAD family hydrolase [Thermomicrobiales bacterium]HRA48968.1 HAD family hydrolase [Thermomicrobiales bacterium]